MLQRYNLRVHLRSESNPPSIVHQRNLQGFIVISSKIKGLATVAIIAGSTLGFTAMPASAIVTGHWVASSVGFSGNEVKFWSAACAKGEVMDSPVLTDSGGAQHWDMELVHGALDGFKVTVGNINAPYGASVKAIYYCKPKPVTILGSVVVPGMPDSRPPLPGKIHYSMTCPSDHPYMLDYNGNVGNVAGINFVGDLAGMGLPEAINGVYSNSTSEPIAVKNSITCEVEPDDGRDR